MGLILFPYLLLAIIVFIMTLVLVIKSIINKKLVFNDFIYGIITTFSIYLLLFFNYKMSDEAYVLGAFFMFPFFMIFLPFFGSIILKVRNKPTTLKIANILVISVMLSGILMVVFNQYTFEIVDYMGIKKIY
uniref:hypothetical protein n=1 Tax=Flavobacterium sp. TaxID=239 RepID=UPI00404B14FE